MSGLQQRWIRRLVLLSGLGLAISVSVALNGAEEGAEPAPPDGQTYIGSKKCSACHFDQFLKWKATPHAKAFDILTDKYQEDEKCLKCHTTGFGHDTGFKSKAATPSLVGISCESCHGPGSKHEEIAKPFADVKKLDPADEKKIRDSIYKMLPKNVCVECHMIQGHHPSQTPPEMRKKS